MENPQEGATLFDVHTHHPSKSIQPQDTHLVCVSGFSKETNREALEYASSHPRAYFSLGLAPQETIRTENPESLLSDLKSLITSAKSNPSLAKRLVAIGECGLDYHWAKEEAQHETERKIFSQAIALASSLNLPLVIHSRDAEEDCIKMLRESGFRRVLLHCFGGTLEQALQAERLGWLISIPPALTGKRKKIIKALKPSSIVVESDAPYIGKLSSDARKAAVAVAGVRGENPEDVLAYTCGNAKVFFGVE